MENGVRPGEFTAPAPKYVGAVENAVRILRRLARSGRPEGAASIARETGVNASTAFNILRTLAKEGLASFDPQDKTYGIGLGVLELSAPILGANQAELIRPALIRLAESHRVLMGLWLFGGRERMVLLDRVAPHDVVRVEVSVGSRLPSCLGAVGRAYAAARGYGAAQLRQRFEPLRWHRAPDFDDYAADVAEAGRTGLAFDRGRLFPNVDIAAAVVRDHRRRPRFGLSGITLAGLHTEDAFLRMAGDLREEAGRIEAALFGASACTRPPEARRKEET